MSNAPHSSIKPTQLNVRVRNFQTVGTGTTSSDSTIPAGTPIGLLLVLTYATQVVLSSTSQAFFGDLRPNVSIR